MPKDSDKPGCDDKRSDNRSASSSAAASEDMSVSKTAPQSPPSPQRGSAPQSSPPRFVSVEELMETAKSVSNMALAHEIVVNGAFQVKPSEPPEGSLERRVKDIMHKAFWDCLETQLNEEPPSYDHAIKLLAEIKETLLSFLLPGHGRLRVRIEECLDLALIQQQAKNGALDLGQVVEFVIGMMGSLCAPSRDPDIEKLRDITDLVPLLRAIFSVLDGMKIDMANFAVSSIRPHLLQQSVEYERKKFQDFLEKQPNALDYTEKWLQDTVQSLRCEGGGGGAAAEPPSLQPLSVHNHAYLRLLTWDHISDPFPETLQMDQVRFRDMQRELERLVLEASVLLMVYNTAGGAISGLPGLLERLKTTVRALLSDMHTPCWDAGEVFAAVGERLCLELSECLSAHGFSPFTANRRAVLKGQISAVTLQDNTIRKLMESRIQTYMLQFLESSPREGALGPPGGLAPVSRELEEIAVKFGRLVNFNKLVFSPFYQKILQASLQEGGGPDTTMG